MYHPRQGLRLEWRDLRQPIASRQGDDRHKLERPSLLRLANGRVGPIGDDPSQVRGLRHRCAVAASTPIKDGGAAFADDLAGRRRRHESKRQNDTALRRLHPRLDPEHGLEQEFNSLDNQREASEATLKSQAHEGWRLSATHYDDGGYSGGSMDRPALQRLLDDVRARRIDVSSSQGRPADPPLADFAKLVELFDAHQVSFVSVTQVFNTTTSMGTIDF